MKATPNGRLTTHTAMIDLSEADPISIKGGKLYPYRVIVGFQYSWADGAWHVIRLEVQGHRTTAKAGAGTSAKYSNPDASPEWVRDLITTATPAGIAPAEMVR